MFMVPALSALCRSDADAFDELLSGVGVSGDFIHQLRNTVVPNSSALIVLAETDTVDRVNASLTSWQPQHADAFLPDQPQGALRAVFAD